MSVEIEDSKGHLQVTDKAEGEEITKYILTQRLINKKTFPKITEEVNDKWEKSYTKSGIHKRFLRALPKHTKYERGLSEEEKKDIDQKFESIVGLSEEDVERESLFRIGYLDIETTGLSADFGYTLCAVILDEESGMFDVVRIDETKGYYDKKAIGTKEFWKRVDKEILTKFVDMFNKYDIIVHFNGKWFDMAFLNTRLLKHGLKILPDVKQVDIYQVARKHIKTRSKRLDAIKEFLEVDTDVTGHDWEYWQMAGARVKEGLDYVVDHCKRDVERLRIVTHKVKPLIKHIFRY